jgi:general secretion pathway protein K
MIKPLQQQQRLQHGVAIVLAMSVVALAAIAAIAIMVSQSTWARQSELRAEHVQAEIVVQAGIDWSRAVLSDDRRVSTVDHLGEPWALKLPAMPVENGKLEGFLEDQQGKFNLNNLVVDGVVNANNLLQFQRLLKVLGLPISLADKLADWIDGDSSEMPAGAEDSYYLMQQPAYFAANRPLIDVAELAQVAGFDVGVRERLRPFVSALPRYTPVNVNTTSPEVLAAIVEGLDIDGARALVAKRDNAYFRDRADFVSRLSGYGNATVANEVITVSSDYFLTWVQVTIGEAEAHGSALLQRQGTKWPEIVWHKTL